MNVKEYFAGGTPRLDELYHCNSKNLPQQVSFATAVQVAQRDRRLHEAYRAARGRYKCYSRCRNVAFPPDRVALRSSLDEAIAGRRSHRTFAREPISMRELATLLAASYGEVTREGGEAGRAVPSGGGLYPLDLYILQFPEGPAPEGVYHYHVGEHVLQCVSGHCSRQEVQATSMYPEIVSGACVLVVIVADMRQVQFKYGERSYRLVLLEAGHVSQNLYLIASALGVGVVALDGFYDDRLHELLDVDGVVEIVVTCLAVGKLS